MLYTRAVWGGEIHSSMAIAPAAAAAAEEHNIIQGEK